MGNLYMIDLDLGETRLVGATGFSDVSGLAFVDVPGEPIPEPATVTLLGAGVLALGWGLRRRR